MFHQQVLPDREQEDHVGGGRHGGGGGHGDQRQPRAQGEPDPGGVHTAGQGAEDCNSQGGTCLKSGPALLPSYLRSGRDSPRLDLSSGG